MRILSHVEINDDIQQEAYTGFEAALRIRSSKSSVHGRVRADSTVRPRPLSPVWQQVDDDASGRTNRITLNQSNIKVVKWLLVVNDPPSQK